jgi:hypothetical protein
MDALHGGTLADQRADRLPVDHDLAQPLHFRLQLTMFDRPRDTQREQLGIDRLRKEVVGAHTHRRDGGLDAAVAGDDDDWNVGSRAEHPLGEIDAGHLVHAEVGHDAVEVLAGSQLERRLGRGLGGYGVPEALEGGFEQRALVFVIVDYKHTILHDHRPSSVVWAVCRKGATVGRARELLAFAR